MFEILSMGMIAGLISSSPIGPINLWAFRICIEEGWFKTIPFVVGVLAADVLVAGICLAGHHQLVLHGLMQPGIMRAMAIIFICIGASIILAARSKISHRWQRVPTRGKVAMMTSGFLFCILNPAFFLFWSTLFTSSSVAATIAHTEAGNWLMVSSIAMGDAVWFALLMLLASRIPTERTTPYLKGISQFAGFTMIVVGAHSLLSN